MADAAGDGQDLGALGLLVGLVMTWVGVAAACGVILLFVGAFVTHVRACWYSFTFPGVYLALAVSCPFDAIGDLVGRTPTACQLASRARRTIRSSPSAPPSPGGVIDVGRERVVAERFIAACAGGHIGDLLDVLDPAVVGGRRP